MSYNPTTGDLMVKSILYIFVVSFYWHLKRTNINNKKEVGYCRFLKAMWFKYDTVGTMNVSNPSLRTISFCKIGWKPVFFRTLQTQNVWVRFNGFFCFTDLTFFHVHKTVKVKPNGNHILWPNLMVVCSNHTLATTRQGGRSLLKVVEKVLR